MNIKDNSHITVWFSCGVASAVAAKKTVEQYPNCNIRIVNNPIKEEDEDNQRFLKDVENWIGKDIEFCINPNYPNSSVREVWKKRKYMSGVKGAICTFELKREARRMWELNNISDYIVLGFTYDEIKRHENFKKTERNNIIPILIDLKITKQECFDIINKEGIDIPRIYKMGYPNANCIGCVKVTSPTYWNMVREKHPEVFKERAEDSRDINCKLTRVNGKRIFLDELDPKHKGYKVKKFDFECGIFCENDFNNFKE